MRAYREAMAEFAQMRTMDIWYAHLAEETVLAGARGTAGKKDKGHAKALKTAEKNIQKARTRDSLQALSKLAEVVDGRYRIVSQPPIVVPARDLAATGRLDADQVEHLIREQRRTYRATRQADRRHLLERSRSSTSPARSSVWAASAPGRSSCCCRAAISRTRCSCNSRRPPRRCSKITCPRADTGSTASGWYTGSG